MTTFLEIKQELGGKFQEIIPVLANSAINYFESRITEQVDVSGTPFRKRNPEFSNRKGRDILMQSGNLRRSIQLTEQDSTGFTIAATMDYAEIHNEGGELTVTEAMKSYFWAKYYELVGRQTKTKRGERRKTKQNKQLNADAEIWKAMALKKVGSKIVIPKRQFIGETEELKNLLITELNDFLKDYTTP